MAENTGRLTDTENTGEVNGWAMGFTFFASIMMALLGSLHFIQGLVAVIDKTFYSLRPNYSPGMAITTWGWVQMVGGVVLVLASFGLLFGSPASRIVTIIFAGISALWSVYSIPYYPVWSIMTLALSLGVLWALIAHPRAIDVYDESYTSPLD